MPVSNSDRSAILIVGVRMVGDLVRTGTLQRWAYVGCFATCLPGAEEPTFQRMKKFIAAAVPEFQLAAGRVAKDAPLSAAGL